MKLKNFVRCKECGKRTKSVCGPTKDLCRVCFNRSGRSHLIWTPIEYNASASSARIFKEKLAVQKLIAMNLTGEQADAVKRRLDFLFPSRDRKEFRRLSEYVRLLILNDLTNSGEMKGGEDDE